MELSVGQRLYIKVTIISLFSLFVINIFTDGFYIRYSFIQKHQFEYDNTINTGTHHQPVTKNERTNIAVESELATSYISAHENLHQVINMKELEPETKAETNSSIHKQNTAENIEAGHDSKHPKNEPEINNTFNSDIHKQNAKDGYSDNDSSTVIDHPSNYSVSGDEELLIKKQKKNQKHFLALCKDPSTMKWGHFKDGLFVNHSSQYYMDETKNCTAFREKRQYPERPGTSDEKAFPIAYSILMYTDVDRAERLLRAIYQPQNFYCFHVDKGAEKKVKLAVEAVAGCFHNVFLAGEAIRVKWGSFSVLEAELVCMRALSKYKWKYFINLTGQEFPLKTNWELVQIFTVYNGANDVDGTTRK